MRGIGVGFLVLVILAAGAGAVTYMKVGGFLGATAGQMTEAAVGQVMTNLRLPAAEKQSAMAPIRKLSADMKSGQVPIEKGLRVLGVVLHGPVQVLVACRGFEAMHLLKSGLTDEDKQQARMQLSRFCYGVSGGMIDQTTYQEVFALLTETDAGEGEIKQTQLKAAMDDEQVATVIAKMKSDADIASVQNKIFQIDLGVEVQKEVELLLARPVGGGARVPAPAGTPGATGAPSRKPPVRRKPPSRRPPPRAGTKTPAPAGE